MLADGLFMGNTKGSVESNGSEKLEADIAAG